MRAFAVLLAAGQGSRLGREEPKALVRLLGRTLLSWSASALEGCSEVEAIQPVLPPGAAPLESTGARWLDSIEGGLRRQDSVSRGLAAGMAARPDLEWVLVHDAARCLVDPGDVRAVLYASEATGAALPVVPASDTTKWLSETGSCVERTLTRGRRRSPPCRAWAARW